MPHSLAMGRGARAGSAGCVGRSWAVAAVGAARWRSAQRTQPARHSAENTGSAPISTPRRGLSCRGAGRSAVLLAVLDRKCHFAGCRGALGSGPCAPAAHASGFSGGPLGCPVGGILWRSSACLSNAYASVVCSGASAQHPGGPLLCQVVLIVRCIVGFCLRRWACVSVRPPYAARGVRLRFQGDGSGIEGFVDCTVMVDCVVAQHLSKRACGGRRPLVPQQGFQPANVLRSGASCAGGGLCRRRLLPSG